MNRRLSNVRTRQRSGFEYAVNALDTATPYGRKKAGEMKPFFPGEEEELRDELDTLERMVEFKRDYVAQSAELALIFMDMRECTGTVASSKTRTLSTVELYEMKCMLIKIEQITKLFDKTEAPIPDRFIPVSVSRLLDRLDPRQDRMATFYIYEEFSEKLATLREEKRKAELELRKGMKAGKEALKKEKGIVLTPKFDCRISRSDEEQLEKLMAAEELEIAEQDNMWVTFVLKQTEEDAARQEEIEKISLEIEDEEEKVRERLSGEIWKNSKNLFENCERIGELDLTLAKADFAIKHRCVKPVIIEEHRLVIKEGRQMEAEESVTGKGGSYMPVSVELYQGVTCITGANMGGKTISLKMIAQTALLAQYGFFVPCREAEIGLSAYMQMLVGDSQSVERGLSSFGSEMEELKEIFDHCRERSVILVDEIASGTNPAEGAALTKSIIDFLKDKPYITVFTTHFDVPDKDIQKLRAVGLENADFGKIGEEIRYANRKERINIIGKYMDYRLIPAGDGGIPKDALNIASMLGIDKEVIEKAKVYLKGEDA